MDLLLISDENKLHYVYPIPKISIDLCAARQKIKMKTFFAGIS